jgi:antirestriction protein ArdC
VKNQLAERVTQRIIDQLESGVVPWQKPWTVDGLLPTSGASKKTYRGINTLILSTVQFAEGYKSPYWLTYKQAEKEGAHVRKGEKATPIVFWKVIDKPEAKEDESSKYVVSRSYNVFNLDQIEGLEIETPEFVIEPPDQIQRRVLSGYEKAPQVIYAAQGRASYSPALDRVTLPPYSAFNSNTGHLATLFHELVHSTGHESRLNRFAKTGLPNEEYAEEELVAEIGAAILNGYFGLDVQHEQSASYIASWLSVLKNDRNLLVNAAQKAQKAVDLLNVDGLQVDLAVAA